MNHKFINISIMLLNIFVAGWLVRVLRKSVIWRAVAICAFALLIATGIADFAAVWNVNKSKAAYETWPGPAKWAREKTKPEDIFLTSSNVHEPVLWSGRRAYLGWKPFAHSAGYNIETRSLITQQIYQGHSLEMVRNLLSSNRIDYIVLDEKALANSSFSVDVKFFEANFTKAYEEKEKNLVIYKALP